jgi:His-Xaa-Ser system protein HxsD
MQDIIKKIDNNNIVFNVNIKIYETKALLQTVYKFTDNCFIHIEPISEDINKVYFEKKDAIDISLEELAKDFCNELIDQQVRINIEKECGNIRNEIVKKAFSPMDD